MSHQRAHAPVSHERRSHGTGRRIVLILFVGVLTAGIVSLFSGTSARSIVPPPPPQSISRMPSGRLQEYAAENAIVFGANAGDREVAMLRHDGTVPITTTVEDPAVNVRVPVVTSGDTRIEAPKPTTLPPSIRIQRVRSTDPHPTRDRAMSDALAVARDKLLLEFRLQDPPVDAVPTLDFVRANFVRSDSIVEIQPTAEQKSDWTNAKLDANRVWIEMDVEVTDTQLRQLRATQRFDWALLGLGGVLIAAAALYGFLRVDTWTKGYLTWTLAILATAIAGAGIGFLALVK